MHVQIRPFRPDDAPALFAIFYSAVHELTCDAYTPAQRDAWAPADFPASQWAARLVRLQPLVVELDAHPVAYADVQADGLIDHFFVAAGLARRGLGQQLMLRLHEEAARRGLCRLYADVSLSAQPFFARQGFLLLRRNSVLVRGERLVNLRMQKTLSARTDDAVESAPA